MAEHPHASKRQRLEDITDDATGAVDAKLPSQQQQQQQRRRQPWVASLFQVPAGLPREPSPGAMHGCRIAAWVHPDGAHHSTYGSVLASGAHVYWSQLCLPQPQQLQLQAEQQGKEGVLLPLRLQAPAVTQLSQLPAHAGEVQALALARCTGTRQMLLATVDAFGAGSISRLEPCWEYAAHAAVTAVEQGEEEAAAAAAEAAAATAVGPVAPPAVVVQGRIQPLDGCREGGWAGVCFSGSGSSVGDGSGASAAADPLLLATARGFARDVTLHDVASSRALRSFGCLHNPYALTFLPAGTCCGGGDGRLLAVAEGHLVSLWDVRAGGADGGCVQRLSPGAIGQPLYTLAWCKAQAGLLGAAGSERSVFMTEPRKWRVVNKWNGAARQAIHSLSFLDSNPSCAVLAGLDLEVLCGRWDRVAAARLAAAKDATAAAAPEAAAAGGGKGAGAKAAPAAATSMGAVPAGWGRAMGPLQAMPGAHGSGDGSKQGAQPAAAAAAGDGGAGEDGGAPQPPTAASTQGVFSFRGDGRWLGVSKAAGADVLAGFAASGNLVYARVG